MPSLKTVWPSGLRRWLKAPFRKGVGSNPTAVTLRSASDPAERLFRIAKRRVGPSSPWRRLIFRGRVTGKAFVAPAQDSLAERSKAVAQGAIPKGRGFEPHSCHFLERAKMGGRYSVRVFSFWFYFLARIHWVCGFMSDNCESQRQRITPPGRPCGDNRAGLNSRPRRDYALSRLWC